MINPLKHHICTRQNAGRMVIGLTALSVTLFFYSIVTGDAVVGFLSDDAIYLILAEIYSPWNTVSSPVHEFIQRSSRFPPLYPLLLGLFGVDTDSPPLAAYITISFLLMALLIIGIWLRTETRSVSLAVAVPLFIAFLPSTLILSQELWSEFLFMCFLYGTFAVLSARQKTPSHWMLAALMVGLASMTRSIGVTVIAAFALSLVWHRPKRFLWYVLISATPFLYWQVHEALMRDMIQSYWVDPISHFEQASLSALTEFFMNQAVVTWQAWCWLFSVLDAPLLPNNIKIAVLLLLLLLALTGFVARLKRGNTDALCLCFYLPTIFIWPHPGVHYMGRFLYPLLPLFIFYGWLGLTSIVAQRRAARFGFAMIILLVAAIAYPSTGQFINRAYADTDIELRPYRRSREWLLAPSLESALEYAEKTRAFFAVLARLPQHIPKYECVYAVPHLIVTLHSLRMTVKLPSPPITRDELIGATRVCRFILAIGIERQIHHSSSVSFYPPFYPLEYFQNSNDYAIMPFYTYSMADQEPLIYLIERKSR